MNINPLFTIDAYKLDHRRQYPENTTMVYSNFTARSGKLRSIPDEMWTGHTVFFGLQYFIKDYLIDQWNKNFFSRPKDEVVREYARRVNGILGPNQIGTEHIEDLHDLGYLPIEIRALEEGTLVPIGIPYLTVHNTVDRFFWVTNYLETVLSAELWKPITTATIAYYYRKFLNEAAGCTNPEMMSFVQFQGHDFSARGMSGKSDAAVSGMGHILSFSGTDTISAIDYAESYYNADANKEMVGVSVAATEHSCMSLGTSDNSELGVYRRLLTEVYPTGIVSIVSDTYDFFNVVTNYMQELRDIIINRDGKLVLRPDSGDPVKIICGDPDAPVGSPEYRGAVECLWNIFGGTVTSTGYKQLDSHIGLIYGDSITPQRCIDIIRGLYAKGFASTNIVFGIGSYTYNFLTRDTFGMAVKSTYGEINGQAHQIFKDPATDKSKMKKSLRGAVAVRKNANGDLIVVDGLTNVDSPEVRVDTLLDPVFRNGRLLKQTSLNDIRNKLSANFASGGIVSAAVSGPSA